MTLPILMPQDEKAPRAFFLLRNKMFRGLFALFFLVPFLISLPCLAQAVDGGTISRQLELTLPQLPKQDREEQPGQKESKPPPVPTEALRPSAKSEKIIPIWEEERDPPDEQMLGAPIKEIYIFTPKFRKEAEKVLQETIFNKDNVGSKALAAVRSKLWELYIKDGFLVHVAFKLVPNPKKRETSILRVRVSEIKIQEIIVRTEGAVDIRESAKEAIRDGVAKEFKEGKILNLQELDARVKHRLRLGDYNLRISLEPVDKTKIKIIVIVSEKEGRQPTILIQGDNAGMRSFGQTRLVGVVSAPALILSGDRTDLTFLKTYDLKHNQYNGLAYGRLEYAAPVAEIEARLSAWVSAMHYHSIDGVSANPDSNGEAYELGVGLLRPLYTGKKSVVDGKIEFVEKLQTDRFDKKLNLADKSSYSGRVKINGSQALSDSQLLSYGSGITIGSLDLSGCSSSLEQDRAGPKTNGLFSKMEANGMWMAFFGEESKWDLKVTTRGQIAFNNLDSMEKFTLGGSSGLRAFGPGEASGDAGALINGEVGYALNENIHSSAFYDLGLVRRNMNDYGDTSLPGSYLLHDIGASFSFGYKGFNSALTFAHQVGPNPGLDSKGNDSDGLERHYRVWYTLSYSF